MSATQAGAITAVLLQLLNALDARAQEAAQRSRDRVDPKAYHRMRLQPDAMRVCSQDLPGLAASRAEAPEALSLERFRGW